MVVAAPTPLGRRGNNKKTTAFGIPTIDMFDEKSKVCEQIVKACEDYGFFKVVNHGVPKKVIARMEREAVDFFSRPVSQKQQAGPATPFGYGRKNIGFNGDMGDLEYILLEANPLSISQRSKTIANHDPFTFSNVTNNYVNAVKKLTCDILDLVAEGLWIQDKSIFSKLISDCHDDSCFRINHYPSFTPPNHHHHRHNQDFNQWNPPTDDDEEEEERLHISPLPTVGSKSRIGFGEHTDPQILTILRSNDVSGLQICTHDGFWLPVPPDPNEFYVFVGDAFQALTNGRFTSVRHRAMANSWKTRMSMMYFAAPAVDAWIKAPPQIKKNSDNIYRAFTWGEFKQTVYSLRLADSRLDHFKNQSQ